MVLALLWRVDTAAIKKYLLNATQVPSAVLDVISNLFYDP